MAPSLVRILLIMNGLVREQIDRGCGRINEIAKQWQKAEPDAHLTDSQRAPASCEPWGFVPTLRSGRWRGSESR